MRCPGGACVPACVQPWACGLSLQTYSQLAHPIQQARALGLQFHSRILDIDNVDVSVSPLGWGRYALNRHALSLEELWHGQVLGLRDLQGPFQWKSVVGEFLGRWRSQGVLLRRPQGPQRHCCPGTFTGKGWRFVRTAQAPVRG